MCLAYVSQPVHILETKGWVLPCRKRDEKVKKIDREVSKKACLTPYPLVFYTFFTL